MITTDNHRSSSSSESTHSRTAESLGPWCDSISHKDYKTVKSLYGSWTNYPLLYKLGKLKNLTWSRKKKLTIHLYLIPKFWIFSMLIPTPKAQQHFQRHGRRGAAATDAHGVVEALQLALGQLKAVQEVKRRTPVELAHLKFWTAVGPRKAVKNYDRMIHWLNSKKNKYDCTKKPFNSFKEISEPKSWCWKAHLGRISNSERWPSTTSTVWLPNGQSITKTYPLGDLGWSHHPTMRFLSTGGLYIATLKLLTPISKQNTLGLTIAHQHAFKFSSSS